MSERRPQGSDYLQWAKTSSDARYNLTSSGLPYLPLRELPVTLDELELSGSGAYGWAPLQQAIAERYRVDERCVVAAQGTSMANHLAMAALLEPGDEVLVEHPTYEPLLAVARYLGARVTRFARRAEAGFQLEVEEVRRTLTPATRLVVLTNLHNPSSAYTPLGTLRELGALAAAQGARVLVDEVYLDARFGHAPETSFHLGPEFVATSSLTKVYGLNGLRCGWILADEALAGRLWRLNELFSNIGAHPAERLSVAAFRHLDAISARSRAILEQNGATLNAFYHSRDDLAWQPHLHGTVSFPRLISGDGDQLAAVLRECFETSVVPGRFFEAPEHVRIALGVAPATFAEGMRRVGQALDAMSR